LIYETGFWTGRFGTEILKREFFHPSFTPLFFPNLSVPNLPVQNLLTQIARTPLSRRTFLRTTGAALALPFLDAMQPVFGKGADLPRFSLPIFLP